MLRDADLAMYRAKESGGNRYEVFDDELRTAALARLEVERELRRAIRTGQLVVHFQPIVEVETGRVDRLEALVRWQHPTRGMVPPGQFLSVAAESGLIVDVGEHVPVRRAVRWRCGVRPSVVRSVCRSTSPNVSSSTPDSSTPCAVCSPRPVSARPARAGDHRS
ncbi:MAG: EAL domain-containing protein [Acidimicrobiales bacterium]